MGGEAKQAMQIQKEEQDRTEDCVKGASLKTCARLGSHAASPSRPARTASAAAFRRATAMPARVAFPLPCMPASARTSSPVLCADARTPHAVTDARGLRCQPAILAVGMLLICPRRDIYADPAASSAPAPATGLRNVPIFW